MQATNISILFENLRTWATLDQDARIELARQIIDRFDSEFDALNRRNVALGALKVLLSPPPRESDDPSATVKWRALQLGHAWCRIVDADVDYDLLRGLDTIRASAPTANELNKHLDDPQRGRLEPTWIQFTSYVLARWHDARGRIEFRCGDMQAAQKQFRAAVRLVDSAELKRCASDVQSNLRRAEHDAALQVGEPTSYDELRDQFEHLIRLANEREENGYLESLHESVRPAAQRWWTPGERHLDFPTRPLIAARDDEQHERLRGLSNLEHNLAVVLKRMASEESIRKYTDLKTRYEDESREHSERSAQYALAIGDQYRFAQALRHLVNMLPDSAPLREAMCHHILRLYWPRGHWMARQHLGRYLETTGRRTEAHKILVELLHEISAQQRERGDDSGVDVDVLSYTASDYAKLNGPHAEEWQLKAARSMRRVVKSALYRRRFKESVLPHYTSIIEKQATSLLDPHAHHSSKPEALERLLALVEETTARELLDCLVSRGNQHDWENSKSEHRESNKRQLKNKPARGSLAREATLRHGLRIDPASKKLLVQRLLRDREQYEAQERWRAAAAGDVDPHVAQSLRQLSAQAGGPTVVRFFSYGDHVAAALIDGGSISVIKLCDNGNELKLKDLARSDPGEEPTPDTARWFWETLFKPIWTRLPAPKTISHLVIIPAPGMFALPLHVALVPAEAWPLSGDERRLLLQASNEAPLCAIVPLSFTVSATAYVTQQRHLLRTQPFDPADDLCALVPSYQDPARRFFPGELANLDWTPERFHLASREDIDGAPRGRSTNGDLKGLHALLETRAEVFVFAGHGSAVPVDTTDSEVALELDEVDQERHYLTQYELLSGARLEHNKWTLLNACVSGVGADKTSQAEVAGFLKAFIAAGAGALTVTLWPVHNSIIVSVAGALLREAAAATKRSGDGASIDLAELLRSVHCNEYLRIRAQLGRPRLSAAPNEEDQRPPSSTPLQSCPLVLYL